MDTRALLAVVRVSVMACTAGLYAFGLVLIALVRLSGEWLLERRASRSAGAVEGRAVQP